MRKKYIWMKVDVKNNDLPLVIAGSAGQLAIKCGVKVESIRQTVSRAKRKGWHCKYIRVEDDGE